MNTNKCFIFIIITLFIFKLNNAVAKQNIGVLKPEQKAILLKTVANGCDPAQASIDLDINNVRAKLMTGGDMWWDIGLGEARYEIPKGSKKNSLFAGSLWIGGFTPDKQLKVAAQTYRQTGNDYWPGPLNYNGGAYSIDKTVCSEWDKFWKVSSLDIAKFIEAYKNGTHLSQEFSSILGWPARGNGISSPMNTLDAKFKATGVSGNILEMDDREYAPFVDSNNNHIYEPEHGEVPDIYGDQYIWWVYNDKGNTKGETQTEAIGIEVQASDFAFATKNVLNDCTFYKYKLTNRSTNTLDSTFVATWTDADLGWYKDDYIGCDTTRSLGILYNGNSVDGNGQVNSYGANPPMVGIDFFVGPKRYYKDPVTQRDTSKILGMEAFTYFNNNWDNRIGNPVNGTQIYNYMTGSCRNGQHFVDDFQGKGVNSTGLGTGPNTKYLFFGDPDDANGWSECNCTNPPDDRRFIHSSGPFTLTPSAENNITIAAVWTANAGGCPTTSFSKIRAVDDVAQQLFNSNFKLLRGPDAPSLTFRELDRKIVFYLSNPYTSNNFGEKYGYQLDSEKYRQPSPKAEAYHSKYDFNMNDTLYKFEGYRVFQLRNSEVSISQIYKDNGEVNSDYAAEIFQCDIRNGVTQVVNWVKNINIKQCDSCWDIIKWIDSKDSGVSHSFVVDNDAFAIGQDKRLVNYKTYYFVALAYAHNNFKNFDIRNSNYTQDVAYLESTYGPKGKGSRVEIVATMPNSGYQVGAGTAINSDYGDGVVIKRIEGVGNGGNAIQLDSASEAEALSENSNFVSTQPVYLAGNGPVSVKVIDPLLVPSADWALYVYADTSKYPGLSDTDYVKISSTDSILNSKLAGWKLVLNGANSDVIYNESNLSLVNEQLLLKYGLSISLSQQVRPGDDQPAGNGYITSNITFTNPAYAWLAGVPDGEQRSVLNWIRSGKNDDQKGKGTPPAPCEWSDVKADTFQNYESLLANNTYTKATWAPYSLASVNGDPNNPACGVSPAMLLTTRADVSDITDVDVVFTNDKSKWSKCAVVEMSDQPDLTQNGASNKFSLRSHSSWTGNADAQGNPVYASNSSDTGMSYFPGYAINQETGERLNIFFSEDSWLLNHNGGDMIWNPTSTILDNFGNQILGGKHFIYVSKTKYDGCKVFASLLSTGKVIWIGLPTVAPGFTLLPLKDGLIPTDTRLSFRVTRPYAKYTPPGAVLKNGGFPLYTFSTKDLSPINFGNEGNTDANVYMDRIHAVPNPYYAYAAYEQNRLDSRIRIVGLPAKATISIYSLDGILIRRIPKDNAAVAYAEWDVRNDKGLPISSGMYLIHVQAEGLGEKVIKWFGAMRPVDITNY
jgi:hypothetical protein